MIATKTKPAAKKAASSVRTRSARSAAPRAAQRGRSASQPVRGRGRRQVARVDKVYFGKGWFNVSKFSKLSDEQVQKAYGFIENILLPNFTIRLSIDEAFGQGVTLFPEDQIMLAENNKRDGYEDADLRASAVTDDGKEDKEDTKNYAEIDPEDYYE